MRYFVTGATGFIGRRLARLLREAGHEVVAVARNPHRTLGLNDVGVELRPGDVTDKESMRPAMEGVDGVFHVAGWYKVGVRDKSPGERVNVQGTRNVLELMQELGIPKGVYTSTLAVFSDTGGRVVDETYRHDGPWLSEYDRTKWVAHYQVAEPMITEGLPLVIVQPGLTYGPGDKGMVHDSLVLYLRRRLAVAPRKTAFCWGHVDDTANAHILAMEKGRPGESYIIAGPVHTFVEAMELAERITGIPAPRIHPSPGMMKLMSRLMAAVERVAPLALPELYASESLRVIAGVTYTGSNEKARRELGFNPRPLEEGLREALEYEMARLGVKRKT